MIQKQIQEMLDHQFIIRTSDVVKKGIPKTYLNRMVENGQLIKVSRGIYITDWSQYDEYAIFQLQHQKVIYSHLSALYFHGLIDVIPKYKEVTIYTGYNPHRFPKEVKRHFIQKELYEVGVTKLQTSFGNEVRVYDLERTICDLIRERQKIDVEIFSTSLKRYIQSSKKDLRKLYQYARAFHVLENVQSLIEVLYE